MFRFHNNVFVFVYKRTDIVLTFTLIHLHSSLLQLIKPPIKMHLNDLVVKTFI